MQRLPPYPNCIEMVDAPEQLQPVGQWPRLVAGELVLNHCPIAELNYRYDGLSFLDWQASAIQLAAAIELSCGDSIRVERLPTRLLLRVTCDRVAPLRGADLIINGVSIVGELSTGSAGDLAALINRCLPQPSITATVVAQTLQLTAIDGRNISLASTGWARAQLRLGEYLCLGSGVASAWVQRGRLRLIAVDGMGIAVSGRAPWRYGLAPTIGYPAPRLARRGRRRHSHAGMLTVSLIQSAPPGRTQPWPPLPPQHLARGNLNSGLPGRQHYRTPGRRSSDYLEVFPSRRYLAPPALVFSPLNLDKFLTTSEGAALQERLLCLIRKAP